MGRTDHVRQGGWKRVIKLVKSSSTSTLAVLEGFDKTWGARNVLCRRSNLHVDWNWKQQRI